jgi:hypothetical protein
VSTAGGEGVLSNSFGANGVLIANSMGSSAAGGASGVIRIMDNGNGSANHQAMFDANYNNSDGNFYRFVGMGAWSADTTAITAIRVFASASSSLGANTIASGKFELYGIAKQ